MDVMIFLFWVAFLIIIYHYIIFPICVVLLSIIRPSTIDKKETVLKITLIIAAYNEEKVIDEKIKNCFNLDYPKDEMEIIVVSDGSTDRTADLVNAYKENGVIGMYEPERRGKTAALNRAVKHASGEIIIFSDANSMYKSDSIKYLLSNFNDNSVGGVSGRKSIIKNSDRVASIGDSLFWDFESTLKTMQSRIGSISNGDGEMFAVRRCLYHEIPEEIINDDQAITFNIVQQGHRVIYEPRAVSYEEASIIIEDDFRVKARMVSGGYQIINQYKNFLLQSMNWFSIQFFSHKFLRYFMPILLFMLFVSNLLLIKKYPSFFILQLLFYSFAVTGYILSRQSIKMKFFYFPLYYCSVNLAAFVGLYYFISGKTGVNIWKKAER